MRLQNEREHTSPIVPADEVEETRSRELNDTIWGAIHETKNRAVFFNM